MTKTIKSHKGENNGNYKHGGKGTKLYEVWYSMRRRCNCQKSSNYKHYGGRGITVCEEWNTDFATFQKWALDNGYVEGLSIDRIDNNCGYDPSNCRWATLTEQANNQRTTLKIEYNGVMKTLHQWADCLGIKANTLYYRIFKLNWDIERAFTEKVALRKEDEGK